MNTLDELDQTPGSAITSIKTEVIRSLQSADSGVEARTTDYFNNTYAPDIVLAWPRENTVRHVFLRTSSNVGYLIEDVNLIGESNSIVMPLADVAITEGAKPQREELQATSRGHKSLVTQPRSFAELGDRRAKDPVVALASRSLLQGGSGFIEPDRAVGFGESLSTGFAAAMDADAERTGVAVQYAEDVLDPTHVGQVNSFLHAVWVGSGAPGADFPGAAGVTATPTGAGLDLLLRVVDIEDAEFWARMARTLSFGKLAEMSATVEDGNFQRLMLASVGRLKAKALRIVEGAPATYDEPRWFLAGGQLGIRFRGVTAMFAAKKVTDFSQRGVESQTTLSTLKRRAERSDVRLTEVTVGTQRRRFDYGSEDGNAITQDEQLGQFSEAMGTGALVRRATARVGDRDLLADFHTSTANGRTVATFTLTELVTHLPLFADFDAEDTLRLLLVANGMPSAVAFE